MSNEAWLVCGADGEMYNVPWQNGRVFRTPVGILAASFLLRPNTMFHPEGEWSVRLVLPPLLAYRLRQLVAPAYDDVVARGKDLYLRLPLEQQAHRPFRENPFWQAASTEGGLETENVYFTFRLPTIDRTDTTSQAIGATAPALSALPGKAALSAAGDAAAIDTPKRKHKSTSKAAAGKTVRLAGDVVDAESGAAAAKPRRKKAGADDAAASDAADSDGGPAPGAVAAIGHDRPATASMPDRVAGNPSVPAAKPGPMQEVVTRVPLLDPHGQPISNMVLEPDGWDAEISFSVQQYWLRSFGAGVTLRLHAVQLFGLHQRQGDSGDDMEPPLSVAL